MYFGPDFDLVQACYNMAIVTPYDWLIVLNLTCLPIQAFMHDIPENMRYNKRRMLNILLSLSASFDAS